MAQDALLDGLDSYLVFEDDAVFSKDFAERLPTVMGEVNSLKKGWDLLYLGGQHLYKETSPPWPVTDNIVRCNNVNRTHAFAVNARFMVKFCQHIIHAPDYIKAERDMHIDHQLGELHRSCVTLAVNPWMCGQGGGSSNVNGQQKEEEWWNDPGWGETDL
jgi:GR25 family glycosyltransferase involved in LPS biosynthesis